MSSTKNYSKSYVFGLNQQVRMLKQGLKCHRKNSLLQEEEIVRLRKICWNNTNEICSLERVIKKVRRWYQIIIWKR
jgi:hypothetical protein